MGDEYDPSGVIYYRINWYGYPLEKETSAPIPHQARSKVLQYQRRARTTIAKMMDKPQIE